MALEYTSVIVPIETLDEAIDLYGLVLFGMTPNREPALVSPEAFRGIEFTGNINGPYASEDFSKLISKSDLDTFFGPGGRGTVDYKGAQGPKGLQGQRGDATSLRGLQGIPGEDGPVVAQGLQGYQGYQGYQGITSTDRGPQGIQGPKGGAPDGSQGTMGLQGEMGLQGLPGIDDYQGLQGIQGMQGIQGAQGPQGDEFNLDWTTLRRLFNQMGITLSDDGAMSAGSAIVSGKVSSVNGFYKISN